MVQHMAGPQRWQIDDWRGPVGARPVKEFIDAILEADRKAPRKQRHTAHRIYQRLRMESPGCDVSEW